MPNIEPTKDISTLYNDIKSIIDTSKEQAVIQVNNTMILSYWKIGERLKKEILKDKRATYGKEVVKKISEKLTLEYGRGYSRSNLERMMKLYTLFDKEICATLSHKLSWSHFIEFIKIKDNEVVELMDLERDNIHVSEYWLQLPPKELLERKLLKAIERVKK